MQSGGCSCSDGRVVGVVVLRAAVSTIFERVNFRVIVSDRYLYAKPNPNSLGCSRTRKGSSRGGSSSRACLHDYSSISSWLLWGN